MGRTDPDYFERLYRGDADPWGFEDRWYEQRKYALTLAALPDARYGRAFEPGCANGALTERLATRCDTLLAYERVGAAADRARRRMAGAAGVVVEQRVIPDEWPAELFDLVVLSEVGYYFDGADWDRLYASVTASLAPGGVLVAVHWRGPTDYPLAGDEVHRRLAGGPWACEAHYRDTWAALDVWRA